MQNNERAEKFRQIVKNKYLIYTGLFLNLPNKNLAYTGIFIPLLHKLSREGYQKDAEPKEGRNNPESVMTALYENETYKNHFRKNGNQSFVWKHQRKPKFSLS